MDLRHIYKFSELSHWSLLLVHIFLFVFPTLLSYSPFLNHNMNGYREENTLICYFHPKQLVIGVCPLCLNERLLILATKQGHLSSAAARSSSRRAQSSSKQYRKPHITFPKIFAFGGSILSRLEFRHWKYSRNPDHDIASISPEGGIYNYIAYCYYYYSSHHCHFYCCY